MSNVEFCLKYRYTDYLRLRKIVDLNQEANRTYTQQKKHPPERHYLLLYPFLSDVITSSKQEFVLFCLKAGEKGKKEKDKI